MLTTVILDGQMGKAFGREWKLSVNSPGEALRMIDANKPGLLAWIKRNLKQHSQYRVVCEYHDGRKEDLVSEEFHLERKMKSIRFVPLVEGAGAVARIVVGVILLVVAYFTGNMYAAQLGCSLILGGVAEMLAPKPKKTERGGSSDNGKSSYYFDGPANTTEQGVPVSLTYGTCLIGSTPISAALTVDQLL